MNEIRSNIQDKDSLTGKVFGGCRIIKKIGEGGMGAVYLAHHLALNKNVAVKILPPSFAQEEERVKRFIREARSAAQLEHSNIVQIYNIAKHEDFYFIIMQYVDGESLAGMIRRQGKINLSEALKIIKDVASALSMAHQKGIVHRDIKPENIMINQNGEIKLMDFGLARVLDVASHLSRSGDILGTPYYLSPEQAKGLKVDGRADIYALGVTLYYMISGKRPFDGDSTVSIILKHINEKPPPIRSFNPEIPENVSRVIHKMLEKEVANRYQSTEELINDINVIMSGDSAVKTVISSVATKPKMILNRKVIIRTAIIAIVIVIIISIIGKKKQPIIPQKQPDLTGSGEVSSREKERYLKDKLLKRCNEFYNYFVNNNYEQMKPYLYIPKDKDITEEKVSTLINRFMRGLKRMHDFCASSGNKITEFKIRDIKLRKPSADIPLSNAEIEVVFLFRSPKQPFKMIPRKHIWVLENEIWYLDTRQKSDDDEFSAPKDMDSDLKKKPSLAEFAIFLSLTNEQAEKSKSVIQSAQKEFLLALLLPRQDKVNIWEEINSINNSQMDQIEKGLKLAQIFSLEIPGTTTTYGQKLTQIKSNVEIKFKGIFSVEQFQKYKQKNIEPLDIQIKE